MIKNLPSIRSTKGISRDKFEFDTQSRMWQLSRDNTVSLVWIDEFLSASLQNEYISVLKFYAETASAGHANNLNDRFRAFAKTKEKPYFVAKRSLSHVFLRSARVYSGVSLRRPATVSGHSTRAASQNWKREAKNDRRKKGGLTRPPHGSRFSSARVSGLMRR